MARLRSRPRLEARNTTAASRHAANVISQSSGTNAAPIATSNPVAQAALAGLRVLTR